MDATTFDRIVRLLSLRLTRRSGAGLIAALTAAPAGADARSSDATENRRRKKQKCLNTPSKPLHANQHCCKGLRKSGKFCVCDTGYTQCGARCVNLTEDRKNCSVCGLSCTKHELCVAGICICASGEQCGGHCVDIGSDRKHCGECWNTCASHLTCSDGNCQCSGNDSYDCGGYCAATATDATNCGYCGSRCPDLWVCGDGSCTPPCDTSWCNGVSGCCGQYCRDLNSRTNCGACGVACDSYSQCCSGICEQMNTDRNCGACGNACAWPLACVGYQECGYWDADPTGYPLFGQNLTGIPQGLAANPGGRLYVSDTYGVWAFDKYGGGYVAQFSQSDVELEGSAYRMGKVAGCGVNGLIYLNAVYDYYGSAQAMIVRDTGAGFSGIALQADAFPNGANVIAISPTANIVVVSDSTDQQLKAYSVIWAEASGISVTRVAGIEACSYSSGNGIFAPNGRFTCLESEVNGTWGILEYDGGTFSRVDSFSTSCLLTSAWGDDVFGGATDYRACGVQKNDGGDWIEFIAQQNADYRGQPSAFLDGQFAVARSNWTIELPHWVGSTRRRSATAHSGRATRSKRRVQHASPA